MGFVVAVDVDDVCADLVPAWLNRYNKEYDDRLIKADIKDWMITNYVKPECGMKMLDFLQDHDLYDDVKPLPFALEGVRWLRAQGHNVVFVSSCVVNGVDHKVNWMIKHGFITPSRGDTCLDFIAASDKTLVKADVMIDDRPKNLETFNGWRVLFDAPWNRSMSTKDYDVALTHWSEIAMAMYSLTYIRDEKEINHV